MYNHLNQALSAVTTAKYLRELYIYVFLGSHLKLVLYILFLNPKHTMLLRNMFSRRG